jgi:hypothetical protein
VRAEAERREWEAQLERRWHEDAERRRVQNITQSREQLFGIIEAWGLGLSRAVAAWSRHGRSATTGGSGRGSPSQMKAPQ